MKNHYETLGVTRDAGQGDIDTARRKLARQHHPDVGGDTEKMAAINRAYDVLSDPERRARYDELGLDDEQPDVETVAVEILRQLFEQALDDDRNIVEATRQVLEVRRAKLPSDELMLRRRIQSLERRRESIRVNDGSSNIAHRIIEARLTDAKRMLSAMPLARQANDRALEILRAYSDNKALVTIESLLATRHGPGGFFSFTTP